MSKRNFLLAGALALLAPLTMAQTSEPPIRIIIPLGPGTPSDFLTRIAATAMGEELKRSIVIDNKPGANGLIAVQELMKAKPDGNTLMLGGISPMALNVAVVKNLPYDPRKDFTPIGGIYNAFQGYVVSSNLPAKTFPEFIAYAKKNPGKVSVGHYSALTMIQFAAISKIADVKLLMVPYKTNAMATNDVMGGTIDATIFDIATAQSMAKSGKVKVLAITLAERSPIAEGIPTAAETVPGVAFPAWSGLVGPAGMPRDVVQKLNTALVNALRRKDVIAKIAESSGQTWPTTSAEFAAHIDKEITRWVKLANDAGIQPE